MVEILSVEEVKNPIENYITCYVKYKKDNTIFRFSAVLIKEDGNWNSYSYHKEIADLLKDQLKNILD